MAAPRDQVLVTVELNRRAYRDAARLAARPALNGQDVDPATPDCERSDDRLHDEARI
jgi:hypothetical protein